MATLEEEITAIKARIIRLEEREEAAVGDERKYERKQLADMIIAKETRLNTLLQQQTQGK